ncbi:fluoride efflux transporter CrcB [Bizionia sediminis]|uniref:Fluoride-specific ion channel FluC n=1 Tax=Bizionia sediminis TaxID=1737064 RepID=A0ABW5KMQ9_9FLAO
MKQVFLVFIGGGSGSVLRFLISKHLNGLEHSLPYGTFLVNILGSLLIGFILGFAAKNPEFSNQYVILLATGFCGGFTTFSAFAYENHLFLKSGDLISLAIYTLGTFIVGFLAVLLGVYIAK